jgi:hypothetical protein
MEVVGPNVSPETGHSVFFILLSLSAYSSLICYLKLGKRYLLPHFSTNGPIIEDALSQLLQASLIKTPPHQKTSRSALLDAGNRFDVCVLITA